MKYWYLLLVVLVSCSNAAFDADMEHKNSTQKDIDLQKLGPNLLKEIDGYSVVEINNVYWMTRNLDTDTLANGVKIKKIQDTREWFKAREPAWCYFNNDPEYGKIYGRLYNWYSISTKDCLCPKG